MSRPKIRILLADDVPANLRAMQRLLVRRGCEVTTAANGQEAVTIFADGHFDAVLLDLQMPVMDGYQAANEIRNHAQSNGQQLTLIAMSARGSESDRRDCAKAGFTDCVPKPVDLDYLFRIIAPTPADESLENLSDDIENDDIENIATNPAAHSSHLVLNKPAAMKRLQDDETLYTLFVSQFKSDAASIAAEIDAQTEQEQWDRTAHAAHRLRGIAANLAAEQLEQLTGQIEQSAKLHHEAETNSLVSKLPMAMDRVRRRLDELDVP
ncbi:response regulator [Stieleria varia]|nr:response regulator [Stieleria varia]